MPAIIGEGLFLTNDDDADALKNRRDRRGDRPGLRGRDQSLSSLPGELNFFEISSQRIS